MDKAQIARMIDHTILKAEATEKEVLKLCKEAVEYNFASVCINPSMVPVAATALEGMALCFTPPSKDAKLIGYCC